MLNRDMRNIKFSSSNCYIRFACILLNLAFAARFLKVFFSITHLHAKLRIYDHQIRRFMFVVFGGTKNNLTKYNNINLETAIILRNVKTKVHRTFRYLEQSQ